MDYWPDNGLYSGTIELRELGGKGSRVQGLRAPCTAEIYFQGLYEVRTLLP